MSELYDRSEIEEAIEAGWQARNTLNDAIEYLRTSSRWGIMDMLGGNLLTGMMKHSNMDKAQMHVEAAQEKLRIFQRELKDVRLAPDLKVNIEGFTRAADYLFDNIFMDMFVQSKIKRNISELQNTVTEIDRVLEELRRIEELED